MRKFLKYPPIEWRSRNEYCIPGGPSFTLAHNEHIALNGNHVQLKAPRHSPRYSTVREERAPSGQDVLVDNELAHYPLRVMANDCWGSIGLLGRMWAFYGPWMTGCKGELSLSMSVIGRFTDFAFDKVSFFNPKAFEAVLVRYLNDRYGHKNWEGDMAHVPRYHGPIDWESHTHLPVPSASFKIYRRGEDVGDLALPDWLFVFPITEKHFVEICFAQELYSWDEKGSVAFDTGPIQELQDNIFNSITLELASETQARVDEIKAEVGNMQLCKEFAPLKWPTNIYPPEPSAAPETQKALKAGC